MSDEIPDVVHGVPVSPADSGDMDPMTIQEEITILTNALNDAIIRAYRDGYAVVAGLDGIMISPTANIPRVSISISNSRLLT